MIDITSDIQSLTTFRRRSGDFIKQLKKTKLGGGVLNDSSGFPLYGQDHTPGFANSSRSSKPSRGYVG